MFKRSARQSKPDRMPWWLLPPEPILPPPEGLTAEDRKNGWTEDKLKVYLGERDHSVNRTHRLGGVDVGEVRVISSENFDPMEW